MAPLISQDVDSLVGGVSEQPSEIRRDSQVSKANDVSLDPSIGMATRPYTELVTTDKSTVDSGSGRQLAFTSFDGGPNHRYVLKVAVGNTTASHSPDIKAINVETGVSTTVSVPSGNAAYLTKPGGTGDVDPRFSFVQVGDTVLISNDRVDVGTLTSEEVGPPLTTIIWFKSVPVNLVADDLASSYISSYDDDGNIMSTLRFDKGGSGTNNPADTSDSQGNLIDGYVHKAMQTLSVNCGGYSALPMKHEARGRGYEHTDEFNDPMGVKEYWADQAGITFYPGTGTAVEFPFAYSFSGVDRTYPQADSHSEIGGHTPVSSGGRRADPWTWRVLGMPEWTAGTVDSYTALGTTQGIIVGEYDILAHLPVQYGVHPLHWRVNKGYSSSLVVFSNKKGPYLEDIPPYCPDGFTVPITTDGESDADLYYLTYVDSDGTWIEGRKPGEDVSLDPDTMPHALTYDYSTSTWAFAPWAWADRTVGDIEIHVEPSFVGSPINAISFYKDRLAIASGSSVAFSEINEPSNFWRTSIATLLESDRVDVSLSTGADGPGLIMGMSSMADGLLVFTDRAQHLLSSGDNPFIGANISIDRVSENPISVFSRPVLVNNRHFWSTQSGSSSKVWEYVISDGIGRAVEVTGHCPQLISGTIIDMSSDSLKNTVYFITDSMDGVYVYRHLETSEQRIQAAWTKWTEDNVEYVTTINNITYFVSREYVSKLSEASDKDACGWHCHADGRLPLDVTTYSYSEALDVSIFTLGDINASGKTGMSWLLDLNSGEVFEVSLGYFGVASGELLPSGHSRNLVWCKLYYLDVELSEFVLKTPNASTYSRVQPILGGRTQLKTVTLFAKNSGSFKVLTDIGGEVEATEHERTNLDLGGSLNIQDPQDVEFTTDIGGRNTETRVKIKSTSPQPVVFTALRYEVLYHRRGAGR